MNPLWSIEVLDENLNLITPILNPYELGGSGNILEFTKELSDFGQCTFRVSAYDDILTQYGDILQPHKNHIRIRHNGQIVWSGAIINQPKRTSQYFEITAAEYEWYLTKILVQRTSVDPATGTADGIFRIFSTGAMSDSVTAIINETISTFSQPTNTSSALSGLTIGTIENPVYPPNMTDGLGDALTGAWAWNVDLQATYDFQTILYVLKNFGILSYSDFEVDENLKFNFVNFLGNNLSNDINFTFTQVGGAAQTNLIDYNVPRLGERQVNKLWGVATDVNGVVLNSPQTDEASITEYGFMEGIAAYSDVKTQSILDARSQAELPLISTPDELNVTVIINQTTAPQLGQWDIGDLVNIEIHNKGIDFVDVRRIVGVSVQVHNTGRETTTIQTNRPMPWQYTATGN